MLEPEFMSLRDQGRIWFGTQGSAAPGVIRYLTEVDGLVPWTWWPHEDVGHTDEAKKEVMEFAGTGAAFDTPKPERLMKRIIEISTNPGDLVLDSFAGSGTTAAVAHKMRRRWITVESGETASSLIPRRLAQVVAGADPNGVTSAVAWAGGSGFQFCKLGVPLFDHSGSICPDVRFGDLAAHVFFAETGTPLLKRATAKTPLLGSHEGRAVYLLYNGVLGDRRPHGGNILTHAVVEQLPPHPDGSGARVVFGEACRLGEKALSTYGITFRQIPFDLQIG